MSVLSTPMPAVLRALRGAALALVVAALPGAANSAHADPIEYAMPASAARFFVPQVHVEPKVMGTLVESGVASTYGEGDGFQGNLTACGQVFDTHVAQVAHKTLPCGTKVRVEDVDTGRNVDVTVTDRGPYIPGRIVDLSWAAFEQLDPTGPGLLNVRLYVLPS